MINVLFLTLLMFQSGKIELTHVSFLDVQINPGLIVAITFGNNGVVYLSALGNQSVLSFDNTGKQLPEIGRNGQGPGEFQNPMSLSFDDPYLYVMDIGRGKIVRVDSHTRKVIKEWVIQPANEMIVKNDLVFVSFNMLYESKKIVGLSKLSDSLSFDTRFFEDPCCLAVSGAKSSALLLDRENSLWVSYSGEYRLERYSLNAERTKLINREPLEYVVPSKRENKDRFDRKAMGQHFSSFDKMHSLYEVGDRIILYRFKVTSNARLDIFDREGSIVQQNVDISNVTPFGVRDGTLYGYRETEQAQYDVELVKIEMKKW